MDELIGMFLLLLIVIIGCSVFALFIKWVR